MDMKKYKDAILMKNEENAYIDEEEEGRLREYLNTYKFKDDEEKIGVKMHKLIDHLYEENPAMGSKNEEQSPGSAFKAFGVRTSS